MRAHRSIAVLVLLTIPARTFTQEPAAGFVNQPREAVDVNAQSATETAADFWVNGGRRVKFVLFDGAFGAPSSLLAAQVAISGRWERVDTWPPGERIIITLKSGERIAGAFKYSTPEDLVLTTPREQRVAKLEVRQVDGEKKDTSVDGLLRGASIGAGFGVLLGYGRRTFECRAACSIAIGTTLFTPVGALLGWLRDRKHNETEVLYRAP